MKIKISFNDGNSNKKFLEYGNFCAKIVELSYVSYKEKLAQILITLETKEDDNFKPFTTKKGKTYNGRVIFASISRFLIDIKRQGDIKRVLTTLGYIAKACGVYNEFLSLDNKYDTLEDFVNAFKRLNIYDKYVYWCIGAKHLGKDEKGFNKYKSFIVDADSYGLPITDREDNVIRFDPKIHIIYNKKEPNVFIKNENTEEDIEDLQDKVTKDKNVSNINKNISNNDIPDFLKDDEPSNDDLPF